MLGRRYASNIGILLTNKYLLSNYGFKYPIFLTLCHMVSCTIMSYGAELAGLVKRQTIKTRIHLVKVTALSAAFLLSVALGNSSLRFIPVSFAQVRRSIEIPPNETLWLRSRAQRVSHACLNTSPPLALYIHLYVFSRKLKGRSDTARGPALA